MLDSFFLLVTMLLGPTLLSVKLGEKGESEGHRHIHNPGRSTHMYNYST